MIEGNVLVENHHQVLNRRRGGVRDCCVFVSGLTEEAKAGVTLGPTVMAIASNDAITRLRLAKGCCCANMLVLHFLRIAPAQGPTVLVRVARKLQEH